MGYLKNIFRKDCACTDCLPSPCDDCIKLGVIAQRRENFGVKFGFKGFLSGFSPVPKYYLVEVLVNTDKFSYTHKPSNDSISGDAHYIRTRICDRLTRELDTTVDEKKIK